MPLKIEMFPEVFIQLNKEIIHHPELITLLGNHPPDEFYIRMLEIARYVDVVLHGTYQPQDWEKLADICLTKLRAKRGRNPDLIIVQELPPELKS